MTNEAAKILRRIQLADHIAAVQAAKSLINDEFPWNRLVEELADVAEFLHEVMAQLREAAQQSPAEGSSNEAS